MRGFVWGFFSKELAEIGQNSSAWTFGFVCGLGAWFECQVENWRRRSRTQRENGVEYSVELSNFNINLALREQPPRPQQ